MRGVGSSGGGAPAPAGSPDWARPTRPLQPAPGGDASRAGAGCRFLARDLKPPTFVLETSDSPSAAERKADLRLGR